MLNPAELYFYFVEFKDFWPGPGVKWLWTNHHVTLKVFNVYCSVIFSVRIWPEKNNDSTTGPVAAPKPNKREMKSYFLPPQASFVGGNISIRCQRRRGGLVIVVWSNQKKMFRRLDIIVSRCLRRRGGLVRKRRQGEVVSIRTQITVGKCFHISLSFFSSFFLGGGG